MAYSLNLDFTEMQSRARSLGWQGCPPTHHSGRTRALLSRGHHQDSRKCFSAVLRLDTLSPPSPRHCSEREYVPQPKTQ